VAPEPAEPETTELLPPAGTRAIVPDPIEQAPSLLSGKPDDDEPATAGKEGI
jgi:hypothetical protein